jgi:hypothetical protein
MLQAQVVIAEVLEAVSTVELGPVGLQDCLGILERGIAAHKGQTAEESALEDVAIQGHIEEDASGLQVEDKPVLDGVGAVHLTHVTKQGQRVL